MSITENTINEIIKSHVYGMTNEQIAEVYGIPADEVKMIICAKHDDIEAEKAYRSKLSGKG